MKLKVTAHRDGYRRAGRAWTRATTVVDVSEFTEEQAQQLRADPHLVIEAFDDDDPRVALIAVRDAAHAMGAEDPEHKNPDWWDKQGRPVLDVLSERVGFKVSGPMREAALEPQK
jgi:hypothetical protein